MEEQHREAVDAQKQELLSLLAKLGSDGQVDVTIHLPDEDTPLADLFVAVQEVADNLERMSERLREKTRELEECERRVRTQHAALMELATPVMYQNSAD